VLGKNWGDVILRLYRITGKSAKILIKNMKGRNVITPELATRNTKSFFYSGAIALWLVDEKGKSWHRKKFPSFFCYHSGGMEKPDFKGISVKPPSSGLSNLKVKIDTKVVTRNPRIPALSSLIVSSWLTGNSLTNHVRKDRESPSICLEMIVRGNENETLLVKFTAQCGAQYYHIPLNHLATEKIDTDTRKLRFMIPSLETGWLFCFYLIFLIIYLVVGKQIVFSVVRERKINPFCFSHLLGRPR